MKEEMQSRFWLRQTDSNKVRNDSLALTLSNRAILSVTVQSSGGQRTSSPFSILSSNTCSVQSFQIQSSVSCHSVSAALILATELLARRAASETLVQEIIPRSVL